MSVSGTRIVVERLIPEGKALSRLEDGRVVLLSGAVPGDRVEIERAMERRRLVQAIDFRVIDPSPARVIPCCPVVEQCGGCDWMMLGLEEQRRAKLELLREALWRTGKIDLGGQALELFAGGAATGYRSRVRLQVSGGRIGFHQRGSHDLVEPEQCAVSSARLNESLRDVRQRVRAHASALASVRTLELREAPDGTLSLFFEPREGGLSAEAERWIQSLSPPFAVAVSGGEAPAPETWQRFDLTQETYLLAPPGSFTQINWEVNRALIERVLTGVRERGVRTFLDAYAGSGNFSLPLLAQGSSGLAVEANPVAVLAAREAARRQALPSEGFVKADAASWARERAARGETRFDLVLLDPPRAGVKEGLCELAALARSWLAMCSCNPVTLARDLRRLLDLGFVLDRLHAFDMFPQTHHLETLVWLRAPE